MPLDNLYIGTFPTIAPYRGPSSSEDNNDFLSGTLSDLANLQDLWNNHLKPLLDTLPGGNTTVGNSSRVSYPDAFRNGLDGSQVYIDNNQTKTETYGEIFYSASNSRPKTIKESIKDIFIDTNQQLEVLRRELEELSYATTVSDLQNSITALEVAVAALGTTEDAGTNRSGRAIFVSASTATVTGLDFESEDDYSISLGCSDNVGYWYTNKTGNGFTIKVGLSSWTGTIDWIAGTELETEPSTTMPPAVVALQY